MKPQDIIFLLVFVLLMLSKKPRLLIYAGLSSLILSIPLFAKWVFFTAERLTWYAAAFFLCFILISIRDIHKVQ